MITIDYWYPCVIKREQRQSIPARQRHISDLFLGGRQKHRREGVQWHLGREEREKLATRENHCTLRIIYPMTTNVSVYMCVCLFKCMCVCVGSRFIGVWCIYLCSIYVCTPLPQPSCLFLYVCVLPFLSLLPLLLQLLSLILSPSSS